VKGKLLMVRWAWRGVIHHYREYLLVSDRTPVITLGEGNTPLLKAEYLSRKTRLEIFLKCEGFNPTGSFKDRGMTVAISKCCEEGFRAVICASTGNTSASAAAYAARAGLDCFVLIPQGAVALGKLSQALMHGAKVIAIKGNFDQALQLVREITFSHPIALVNSLNPYRIEGQKTAAFEICDLLGEAPDFHALPVGNAGNITAYWKGYHEYYDHRKISFLPRMLGFQAEGAAPIVRGYPITNPQTIATAIRIGNPASWKSAEAARDESGGLIDTVTDDEILEAYCLLAQKEGIFCEPSSAASVAGVLKLAEREYFHNFSSQNKIPRVVCILTGHGLKDPDRAIQSIGQPQVASAEIKEVLSVMGYR